MKGVWQTWVIVFLAVLMASPMAYAPTAYAQSRDSGGQQRRPPIIQHRERAPNYNRMPSNRFPDRPDRPQRYYYPPPMQVFPYSGGPPPLQRPPEQDSCQDRAMAAVRSGQALPFPMIKRNVENQFGGRVVDLRCSTFGPGLVYEVKLARFDGRVTWVAVDARDGRVIGVR